ncbi:MAG: hypothetical protein IKN12_01965 [Selenomonadaceae bacterium]|nr:hypothetical protein [Selenomonadaceae bacterium]
MQFMEEAIKNATCIMVAHRLNTIKKADIIYEIKDGAVIRYDSFEEFEKTRNIA